MDSQCIACVENTRSDSYGDALVVQIIMNLVVVVVVGRGGVGEAAERNSCLLWYKIGRKKAGHLGANEG